MEKIARKEEIEAKSGKEGRITEQCMDLHTYNMPSEVHKCMQYALPLCETNNHLKCT